MKLMRSALLGLCLLFTLATLAFGFVLVRQPGSGVVHAQLSCDNPPPLLNSLQRVWELTDFCQHSVDYDEITSGGVPRDGIPPIDDPRFESIDVASDWLQSQSPVIAIKINDDARAYPLAIMTRHEIVNDVIVDTPVAVTFCPLCNSAIVFDRRVAGETLRFGVSGLLRNGDLIMWDNNTQSWWQQFTGEAIVGFYTSTQLAIRPSQVVGFGQFVEQYPAGQVLSRNTGFGRNYGGNSYINHDSDPFPFAGEPDDRLFPTERVLAGVIGGEAKAYPFSMLAEARVVNDMIGGRAVVAFYETGQASALDAAEIDASRDIGTATLLRRELNDQLLTFNLDDAGRFVDAQTGSLWNVFGTAVEGELAGSQLRQEVAAPHFWFAWAAFQPETAIYGTD